MQDKRMSDNSNNFEEDKDNYTRKIPEVNLDPGASSGRYNQSVKALANFQNLAPQNFGVSDNKHYGTGLGVDDVWVVKWVDYTQKYGLGYLLSNGTTGVYFNDSSKIIASSDYQNFEYFEKKPTNGNQDVGTLYNLSDYPKELMKKVVLLNHFKSYLQESEKSENKINPTKNFIYVKKWMKTKHATIFRLSNKIVQVCFTDKTEILLNSDMKTVGYLNKKGERSVYPLASALDSSNIEMTKRLRYTKDVLMHLLSNIGKDKMEKLIKEPANLE